MNRQTILLISDMRQVYLAEIMTKRGLNVRCLDIRNSGTVKEQLEKLKSFLAEADMLILPIPVTKIPEQKMLNDILNKNLTNDTLVLGGCFSPEQQELLERRDIHYLDFMKDEIVTEENAVATAEGVIAELVNHSPYNIEEAKIIVTGYGCCGRAVAARLKALGARVTVLDGKCVNLPRRMDFMPRILRLDRRKRWGRQCWSTRFRHLWLQVRSSANCRGMHIF